MANEQDNEHEESHFKCGGLLGAVLELNRLCGADEQELKAKDEEWWSRLRK